MAKHACAGKQPVTKRERLVLLKGALDKFNIIPNFFSKKVGIFIPLEVLA